MSERRTMATGRSMNGPATPSAASSVQPPANTASTARGSALVGRQQGPAPVHHRLERLLALSMSAGAAYEELEAVVQSLQQLAGRQVPEVGGGQLEGKGDAVESLAQLHRHRLVVCREPEGIRRFGGPGHEQGQRASLVKARHSMSLLAFHVEGLTAGGEDAARRCRSSISWTKSATVSSRCSQLSNTRRTSLPARNRATLRGSAPLANDRPIVAPITSPTRAGSVTGASSTKNTPSPTPPTSSAATASVSLVLPHPPTPVRVTRRCDSRSSTTRSTSSSRPMSGVAWRGQVVSAGVTRRRGRELPRQTVDDGLIHVLGLEQIPQADESQIVHHNAVVDQTGRHRRAHDLVAVGNPHEPSRGLSGGPK